MRALTYSLAAIFTSITILAMLFKIMHWPGARVALVVGIAGIALIVVPAVALYKYKVTKIQS